MQNLRVLWGATWRGAAWGLLAGTAFALIYAMAFDGVELFSNPYPIPKTTEYIRNSIVVYSMAGIILGAVGGLPAGALGGLMIGASSLFFLSRFRSNGCYRQLAGALAVLCVEIWALPLFYWLDAIGGTLSRSGSAYLPTFSDIVLYVAVPTSLGCVGAALLSRRIATWCINELNKGVIQNG